MPCDALERFAMKPACVSLLVLTLLLAPGRSSADPTDKKAAAAAEASGRAHFQRGQRLSASGDYGAAYREFAAGYALTERPLFLFNMGEAARASGDIAKARESYRAFLRADPDNTLVATAQQRLDDLDRLAPPAPVLLPPVAPVVVPSPSPIETAPAPLAAVEPAPEGRPIWKKWPFWAVVVGGAIAGGAVVYTVSRDDSDPCAGGCSQLNFR
jgi:tetratricopeptide (TPR) repeat protein